MFPSRYSCPASEFHLILLDQYGSGELIRLQTIGACVSRLHPWIAIGLLVAFLMLSIQSYLATHALGEFRLSFWRFGPTELRILLMSGNLALLWRPSVHFIGAEYRLFDVGGAIGLGGMGLMLTCFTLENALRLYREEKVSE